MEYSFPYGRVNENNPRAFVTVMQYARPSRNTWFTFMKSNIRKTA